VTTKTTALVGTATALLLATAACGSSGSGGTGADAAGSTQGNGKEAALTLIANSLPSGLDADSTVASDSGIQLTTSMSYMGMLYSYNGAKGENPPKLRPDLAASAAEASADGLTYTVKLRPGVKSAAGNPLTAEDVLWTMQRIVAAKVNGSSLLGQINVDLTNPVTKVDDTTVAFHLTHPTSLFERIMSLPYLGILDSTEAKKHVTPADPHAREWFKTNTASFGPYKVDSLNPKVEMVMSANPNYWQGKPQVTKATFRTVQDASTALQTAITGQSDYTLTTAASNLSTLRGSQTVNVNTIPTPTTVYMTLDNLNPALTDPRVRRAIALATDRKAIAETVYGGTAKPTTGCLPEVLTNVKTEYDNSPGPEVDKAKALLAEVPGDRTFVIGMLPASFPESESMARILQGNMNAIGLKTEIKAYTSIDAITEDRKTHRIGGLLLKQAPFVPDAGYFFKAFFRSNSIYNYSNYNNPTFDAATDASMQQPAGVREASITTACTESLKDGSADMLVSSGNLSITKKNIGNVLLYPDVAPRLYNLTVG
jgi:peptide/nickel transport system substrate-binding protein